MNNMFNNPMMMMALAGKDTDVSSLLLMSMMSQQTMNSSSMTSYEDSL